MTAYARRFREVPSLEVQTEIESINIIDATPRAPVTGVGSGALMLIGEYEDGPFNEPSEVFGINDERSRFGGFGYQYGDLVHRNASARRHLTEDWNGNAFIKGRFLEPPRKIVVRVDTSVGEVQFAPLASVRTAEGPFRLAAGQQITVDVGAGAVSTTALAGVPATVAGAVFSPGPTTGFTGGEQIIISVDGGPDVTVTFLASDQVAADVAARINTALGYTAATAPAVNQVTIVGIRAGLSGSLTLSEPGTGVLTTLGLTAATTPGTGNVQDLAAVSATELQGLVNALTGVTGILAGSRVVIASSTAGSGSITVTNTPMAVAVGLSVFGTAINANEGIADTIPAGTRVQNSGGDEWVTMRTLAIPEGTAANPNVTSFPVEVRPALDNGTAALAAASTVNVLVDQPTFRAFAVNNGGGLTAALTEDQLDVAYETAFDATIDNARVSSNATIVIAARHSAAIARKGRDNARRASNEGNRGRSFITRATLGTLPPAALADVAALSRFDRVFYTYPGWRTRIPEIAAVGATAGGQGFTDNGEIVIGGDGPLAYLSTALRPEENIGQETNLLGFLLGVEPIEADFNIDLYIAFKAAGICAPRVNRAGQAVYQSEVTTDLTPGRTTQKRRRFADFVQDSLGDLLRPFSKRLLTDSREASIDAVITNFLRVLLSADQPELQRARAASFTNTSAENPDLTRRGISARKIQIQMLASADSFLVETEIGEGVVVTDEL